MTRILITGLSGLIGSALHADLDSGYECAALNRSEVSGVANFRGEVSDFDLVRRACENQDVVVHLAAKAGEHFTWDELLQTNVVGTRNVLEAAAEAGVKRVVVASSGATVSGWEAEAPYSALVSGDYRALSEQWPLITTDMAPRPSGVYGSTKVWGEALARHMVDSTAVTGAMEVVSVRIGYVNAEDRPLVPRHFSVWCSQRDVVSVLKSAVSQPLPEACVTVFANSNNRWGYRDLDHTREVFGFVPRDEAEHFRAH